jgi:2'-5' RNA ligase
MARLRTFLAIDVGDAIQERCVALQEKLSASGARVKWVEPANIHLTLLFLGEVDERDLVPVCKATASVASRLIPFEVEVAGVGCFPDLARPRVVWGGVCLGREQLIALHDTLEPPLLELGCYRREDRPYIPHVTLGRVEGTGSSDRLRSALTRQAKWKGGEKRVVEVLIFSSELRSQGPVYTVLSRAVLGPYVTSQSELLR